MPDAEDPAQKIVIDEKRLKKEKELRREARKREALKRTMRALEELRDPALNPFAELAKFFHKKSAIEASKLSPEKAAAKARARKVALERTKAGLKLIEEEMAGKRALDTVPPWRARKKSGDPHGYRGGLPDRRKRSDKSDSSSKYKKAKCCHHFSADNEDGTEELFGTAKSRRRRHLRRRQ